MYEKLASEITILGVSDNNEELWGKKLWNTDIECISPITIPDEAKVVITTVARWYEEIELQLDKLGIYNHVRADCYVLEFLEDKFKWVEEKCLKDNISKKIYHQVVDARRIGGIDTWSKIYTNNQYFAIPEFCVKNFNEVFIDAGAFVGDTVEKYLYQREGTFDKIYAFEPSSKLYEALLTRVKRLEKEWGLEKGKIICVNEAVGLKNDICFFKFDLKNPSGSRVSEVGDYRSLQCRLDDRIHEKVGFIKADVEGEELNMLRGANEIIRNNKPKLAISIYHTPFDLYEIPIYIKEIVPEYKMAIRHHSYGASETVLYAWCE